VEKARRQLDPLELQDQYETDYKDGYAAYLVGGPPEMNDSVGWLDGWNAAKDAPSKATDSSGILS
jgi:hypothetical protein